VTGGPPSGGPSSGGGARHRAPPPATACAVPRPSDRHERLWPVGSALVALVVLYTTLVVLADERLALLEVAVLAVSLLVLARTRRADAGSTSFPRESRRRRGGRERCRGRVDGARERRPARPWPGGFGSRRFELGVDALRQRPLPHRARPSGRAARAAAQLDLATRSPAVDVGRGDGARSRPGSSRSNASASSALSKRGCAGPEDR